MAAVAVAGFMAWRACRVAEANAGSMARMADSMAKLAQSRPWAVIERLENGDLRHMEGETRGEFPTTKTTTVHRGAKAPPLELPPDGLADPLAELEDFVTLSDRR